jgi:ABC-type bacteriocin/lantibiotic exporter with double-glycine peptidase domain
MVDTSWLRHQVGAARQDNAHLNQSIRGNIAVAGSANAGQTSGRSGHARGALDLNWN